MRTASLARALFFAATACPARAFAGAPYVTDDPEPVVYGHWEVYLASQTSHDREGWGGTRQSLRACSVVAVVLRSLVPAARSDDRRDPRSRDLLTVRIRSWIDNAEGQGSTPTG
jgi:hypothetical protein